MRLADTKKFICCLSEIYIGHCSCVFATSDNPTWGQVHLEASSDPCLISCHTCISSDKILSCLIPLGIYFSASRVELGVVRASVQAWLTNISAGIVQGVGPSFVAQSYTCEGGGSTLVQIVMHFPSICCCCCLVAKSCPTLATPCTVAHQVPLSMRFLRQKYWSGLTFPSPGDLPDLWIEPVSLALACIFFTPESPGKPLSKYTEL